MTRPTTGDESVEDLLEPLFSHVRKEFVTKDVKGGNLIAESFGVQGGFKVSIADIYVPKDFDVLYITGESGSGKTTILKELANQYGVDINDIDEKLKSTPLFLANGEQNQLDTLKALTSVGLSDASLWLNTYKELSDSQRARYEIAIKIMTDDVVIVDEFLSTLDRETAKPVAYSIQKAIRKAGKKLIVATAHDDLNDYLKPDYIISGKAFPSRFEIIKPTVTNDNPIADEICLAYGTKEDYREERLGELHYKGKYTGGTKEFLFAKLNTKTVGVLVSIYNMHTGGRRISRIVVHPSYRGCGVAQAMIKKYIADFPNTDVVASMAMFNPVFERAGMTKVDDVTIKPPSGLAERLKKIGFDPNRWQDKHYLREFSNSQQVRDIVSAYARYASNLVCPAGEYLNEAEIKYKIVNSAQTTSTVLFGLRPRTMAKYVNV